MLIRFAHPVMLIVACFTCALFFLTSNLNIGLLGVIFFLISMIFYCLKKTKRRFILMLFVVCFFTFLLGRNTINLISGEKWWGKFNEETAFLTINLLLISLMGIQIGHIAKERLHPRLLAKQRGNTIEIIDSRVERASKLLFWISFPANVYTVFMKVLYVRTNGYFAYYLSYAGVGILTARLQSFNTCALFLLMASMPTKKNLKAPLYSWLAINTLSILAGGRTTVVTSYITALFYYYYRDIVSYGFGETWLNKRTKKLILTAIPIGIAFLGLWNYLRAGLKVEENYLGMFLQFFLDQGGSVDLIGYAAKYRNVLPQSMYSLGSLIRFLKYNVITMLFSGSIAPAAQTVEMALNGYNFGAAITYIAMPWNYAAGFGLGSCYIAELWLDFGEIGVWIYSIIIGAVLCWMNSIRRHKLFSMYIVLHVLFSIMILPRDTTLNWLMSVLNYNTLVSFAVILIFSRFLSKDKGVDRCVIVL